MIAAEWVEIRLEQLMFAMGGKLKSQFTVDGLTGCCPDAVQHPVRTRQFGTQFELQPFGFASRASAKGAIPAGVALRAA